MAWGDTTVGGDDGAQVFGAGSPWMDEAQRRKMLITPPLFGGDPRTQAAPVAPVVDDPGFTDQARARQASDSGAAPTAAAPSGARTADPNAINLPEHAARTARPEDRSFTSGDGGALNALMTPRAATPSDRFNEWETRAPQRSDYQPAKRTIGNRVLGGLTAGLAGYANPQLGQEVAARFRGAPQAAADRRFGEAEGQWKQEGEGIVEGARLAREDSNTQSEIQDRDARATREDERLQHELHLPAVAAPAAAGAQPGGAAAPVNHGPVVRAYVNGAGKHVNVYKDGHEEATGDVRDPIKERGDQQTALVAARAAVQKDRQRLQGLSGAGKTGAPARLSPVEQRMVDLAKVTLPHFSKLNAEIDADIASLGPLAGRWNDFWTGKVGAPNKEFAHLMDEMAFLDSAITLAHSQGRVSTEIYHTFKNMFDAGKQSPENLKEALKVGEEWMTDYSHLGGGGSQPAPGAPAGPVGTTRMYRGGKPYDIPNEKVKEFTAAGGKPTQ